MTTPVSLHTAPDNRLLSTLPPGEYERLVPHFERVHLPRGKVLAEAGDTVRHAYFPFGGIISLLSMTEDGQTIEVAMVGYEGVVGVPIVLRAGVTPYRTMVQIPCDAMKVKAEVLIKEFNRGGRLQELLLKYAHALLAQVSQSAVCGRFHTVEARLGRWLLVTRDRVGSDSFQFTQEFLSHMLGTPRTVVSVAAGHLQDAGLIRYRRGKITILNRHGLESAACECYGVVIKEIGHFIAA
jgi:CRP-like cAMP-binding protein